MGYRSEPIINHNDRKKLLTMVKDYRDRLWINMQIYTAFRFSELQSLKWKDLIEDGHPVTKITRKQVNKGGNRKTGKKAKIKSRTVNVNKELRSEIAHAYNRRRPYDLEQYVFLPKRGNTGYKPISSTGMNIALEKIQKLLSIELEDGKKLRTHALRKTGVMWFYEQAVKYNPDTALLQTSKWIGHSTTANTMMYLGLDKQQIKNITEAMTVDAARTPLDLVRFNAVEWKHYWKYLVVEGKDPETKMMDYLDFHSNKTFDDADILMAMDYIKATVLS